MKKVVRDSSVQAGLQAPGELDTATSGYSLTVATERAWESEIDKLRIAAYLQAGNFKLPDPDPLRRRADPKDSLCLLVRAPDKTLAATVRLAYVQNRRTAEDVLQGPVPLLPEDFPAITLCRGATDQRFRGKGLMTFLVAMGVEVAHRARTPSALGMQAVGTPHFRAMQEASWQSLDVESRFAHVISIDTPTMKLCYLRRDRMQTSVEHSRRRHSNILDLAHTDRALGDATMVVRKLAKS